MERWQKHEPDNPSPADGASSSSLDYSAPLRSARSNATNPRPCPFYKLSAELSRESLRIPGAVPFVWEQSPGQCKANIIMQKPASPTAADLAKRSLANLLSQAEHQSGLPAPSSPSDLQATPSLPISQPPSMDRPRCSSARHSSLQQSLPPSIAIAEALSSDSVSDAFTATAGGASVDDSLLLSGPLRPATTPSEARDFIMHRFLPAAQTIACESPQTPSRRFLPMAGSAPPAACCGGSFRDYCGAACAESAAVNGPSYQAGNSLIYASPSAIPAWRNQVPEGSFHSAVAEFDDVPTEDDDDEPPLRPRSCGFFPFRIRISIHSSRSKTGSNSSSKHSHQKKRQSDKIGSKSASHSRTPKRLMDILCEDDGEFLVHSDHNRNFSAERERNRVAALKQSPMPSYGSPCARPLYSSDHYCRDNPRQHQNWVWWTSDHNVDETEDCRSFHDATSRFCSPSPAALHGANVRTSHGNHLSALNAGPHGTRSCAGSINGSPHSALTCAMDPHFYNYGLCCCSAHITRNSIPVSYHTQISSPSSCLTPSSLLSSSQDSFVKQDMATVNNAGLDAFSRIRLTEQQAHIVHNSLCEHDDEDKLLSQFAPLTSDGKGINHGNKTEPQGMEEHADATCDMNKSKIAENFASSDENTTSNVAHNMHEHHLQQFENVITGDSRRYENKVVTNHMNGGDTCACDLAHCTHNCHIDCLQKASPYPYHAAHHFCNCNQNVAIHASAISSEKMGDAHERQTGRREFPRSRMAPPLPKSPTHSWLDKTMPLAASAASKCTNRSSRFSDKPAINAAAEPKHKQVPPAAARHSKWEALVKGSQIQPGHLGLSKELFHPSQTTTYTVS